MWEFFPSKDYFKHENNHLKEYYTVYSKDSSAIDSLYLYGKEHIVIGQSGKWFQKKSIKVAITNENPYYLIDGLRTIVYKPPVPVQFSIGPMLMGNQSSLSGGVGVTVRKGIFSISLGYKVF